MRLQGVGIIFALIVLPIILVMSYYIQLEVDTLSLQKSYDSKLLDSTYDAMSAFEINTANEDLSTVSDSLRTIVEASSNVFITTLATNMGMSNASKSMIEPYIPAILFTMYDGYYICAPTRVPTILTDPDGNAVAVGDLGVSKVSGGYAYDSNDYTKSKEWKEGCGYTDPATQLNKYLGVGELHNISDYGQLLYHTETNGVYTTNIENAKMTTKNIVKNYMPYSARYQQGDTDVTVNYTLDNFLTIEGTKDDIYYSKSGYLLPHNAISVAVKKADGSSLDVLTFNQEQAQKEIESGNYEVTVTIADVNNETTKITADNVNVDVLTKEIEMYKNDIRDLRNISDLDSMQTIKDLLTKIYQRADVTNHGMPTSNTDYDSAYEKRDLTIQDLNRAINRKQYELDKVSAIVYYVKGTIFSSWLNKEFHDLKETSIVEISGQEYKVANNDFAKDDVIYQFSDDVNIFDLEGLDDDGNATEQENVKAVGVTEIHKSSAFYTHKHNVIRNSIQYNLNLAMSTYNASAYISGYDYQMPIMQNDEWEQILNNVSIVSFMQGISCGLKTYNNYKVVSSTNNEIVVSPEHIYYVEKSKFNDEISEYHRIDCVKYFNEYVKGSKEDLMSFSSKEVKYDKQYDKNRFYTYTYDHMNLACYDCVNDYNNEKLNLFDKDGENYISTINNDYDKNFRDAYYIAIGKERNNIYKMNAVINSQGFQILGVDSASSKNTLKDIKAIEIVFGSVQTTDKNENILSYKVKVGNDYLNDAVYSISSNASENQTMVVEVKPDIDSASKVSKGSLYFEVQQENSTTIKKGETNTEQSYASQDEYRNAKNDILKSYIKSIRVIYK